MALSNSNALTPISVVKMGTKNYAVQDIYKSKTACGLSAATTTSTVTLYPGHFYQFGEINIPRLNINLSSLNAATTPDASYIAVKEYHFSYTIPISSAASNMTLAITPPTGGSTIRWAGTNPNPGVQGNTYEISIIDGVALCVALPVS